MSSRLIISKSICLSFLLRKSAVHPTEVMIPLAGQRFCKIVGSPCYMAPEVSEETKDLVRSMLQPNPYSRLTIEEVLGSSREFAQRTGRRDHRLVPHNGKDNNGNPKFEELKDGFHMIGQPVPDPEV
ncbi:hypothetical protein RJ641_021903 [Dillenia turbinata]|uniref:Uncharacterized protein n=1 Tax=Dillenia turbinata TaxID=194707 RepID=A0AAN8YVR8_9MAGN